MMLETDKQLFVEKVKNLMEEKNITVREVADAACITEVTLWKILKGERQPKISQAHNILLALGEKEEAEKYKVPNKICLEEMVLKKCLKDTGMQLADTFKELKMENVIFVGKIKDVGIVRILNGNDIDTLTEHLFEAVEKVSLVTDIPSREIIKNLVWREFLSDTIKDIDDVIKEADEDVEKAGAGKEEN